MTFRCTYCGDNFDKGYIASERPYCIGCFYDFLWKAGKINRAEYVGVEQLDLDLFDDRELERFQDEAIKEIRRWVNADS